MSTGSPPRGAAGDHSTGDGTATANLSDRQDSGFGPDEGDISDELANEKRQKDAKDVRLNEAMHVLDDEVTLQRADTRLAAHAEP
jgi:carboxyl-terminal processing protease